jgi:ribonuclease D
MTKPQLNIKWEYIATNSDLEKACTNLASAKRLAIDTEFIGEKYYFAKLEILQIGDGTDIYLIDIPAIDDYTPLTKLIGNPDVMKIFHAGTQDLQILKRYLGVSPLPAFDTQVAAALLGYGAQISLANLTREILGAGMNSKQSTSDWSERPLSHDQTTYAAADVLYLHDLETELTTQLQDLHRADWYDDEMKGKTALLEKNGSEESNQELYRRVKDWMSLSERELAILRELTCWREEKAQKENLPRRTVLRDEGLIELTRFQPQTREKAKKLRRIHIGQLMRHYDEIKEAMDRGAALPKDQWPKKPVNEKPNIPAGVMELCQALLRTESEKIKVASSIITTSSDLQRVIIHRNNLENNSVPLLTGWRREVVGQKVIDLLEGKLVVSIGPNHQLVFTEKQA